MACIFKLLNLLSVSFLIKFQNYWWRWSFTVIYIILLLLFLIQFSYGRHITVQVVIEEAYYAY